MGVPLSDLSYFFENFRAASISAFNLVLSFFSSHERSCPRWCLQFFEPTTPPPVFFSSPARFLKLSIASSSNGRCRVVPPFYHPAVSLFITAPFGILPMILVLVSFPESVCRASESCPASGRILACLYGLVLSFFPLSWFFAHGSHPLFERVLCGILCTVFPSSVPLTFCCSSPLLRSYACFRLSLILVFFS